MPAPLDLVLRQARIAGNGDAICDIGIAGGRIAAIEPRIDTDATQEPLDGRLVIGGFVETHIHLDKSCILDRCKSEQGSLEEAIAEVAAAKRDFTEEDVYARGRRTLEKAIVQGTTRMRTHVEVDPRIGLRSFNALRRLKQDYAWAIDLELCVFPQEGLTNDPGTEELLIEACEAGADVIGGCPYTDTKPNEQIARIFAIARALRPRYRLPPRFRSRSELDAPRRGVPHDRRSEMGRPGRDRPRHQAVGGRHEKLGIISRRLAERGRRGHRVALDRPVPDGPRPRTFDPARGDARASFDGARRELLARHQQRAQSLHAVRRLLAAPDGEPLRQHLAARPAGRHGFNVSTW